MPVFIPVECPYCHSTNVAKQGKSSNGKRRYRCCDEDCPGLTFSLKLNYQGLKPEVKKKIKEMTVNGSGIREQLLKEASDASRVLGANALR